MDMEQLIWIYMTGYVLTAINVTRITHFYRCTLLWPLFWAYIIVFVVAEAYREIAHD